VWVFGVALSHGVVEGLTGFGQLLVGVAALIAALAGLRNMRSLGHVKSTAAEVATKADAAVDRAEDAAAAAARAATTSAGVAEAIGPPNGRTIQEVLTQLEANQAEIKRAEDEIHSFQEYQRTRNHSILGELTEIKLAIPLLIELAERLLLKLNEED
jgi:hypothetical protein